MSQESSQRRREEDSVVGDIATWGGELHVVSTKTFMTGKYGSPEHGKDPHQGSHAEFSP